MSLFDTNIVSTSPITAQSLRDIINQRTCNKGDDITVRCNKILDLLFKKVEYTLDSDVTCYYLPLSAFGIFDSPFTPEFESELNVWRKQRNSVAEYMRIHDIKPVWNNNFRTMLDFFKDRGFKIKFKIDKYVNSIGDNKYKEELVTIDWSE